jgi:uncharacterized protein YndB with AHSA1/START domain
MASFKDSIERELTLPVPIERAWSAITDPKEVRQWFGDQSDFEVRVGGEGFFKWGDDAHRMRIVALDPPRRFSYRWVIQQPDDMSIPFDEMRTTLVEYRLESIPDGTRLMLTESGFASFSEEYQESHYTDNSKGWTEELAKLVAYAETLAAVV